MSSVISFPNQDEKIVDEHFITLRTNRKGELVEAGFWNPDPGNLELEKHISHLMFVAAWFFLRSYGVKAPDDPDRVIALISVANGSRVNVFSPADTDDDAFKGKGRQEWLRRRLKDAFDLALPSLSGEPTQSGMISPSHSANFDQLEFSWLTTSAPSTPTE